MVTSEFTHTSIVADGLAESTQFYEDVFGMERVPAPEFPDADVSWLRCGDRTLHLFDRDLEAPEYFHIAVHVDDFASVYVAVVERDIATDVDDDGNPAVYELPEGAVQLYIRDPAGNLVEVNHHNVENLPKTVREGVVKRSDQVEQTGAAAESRLYFDEFLEEIGTTAAKSKNQ